MEATAILERLDALRVKVTVVGDRVRLEPGSKVSQDLVEELRQHKTEVMGLLKRPAVVAAPPEWHAEEIARLVEAEGICIFWSDLFQEVIAFVKDDSYEAPASIVAYTKDELAQLFGDSKPPLSASTMKLIHEAKKQGGHVVDNEAMQ